MSLARPLVLLSRRLSTATTPSPTVVHGDIDAAHDIHIPRKNADDDHRTHHLNALFPPLRFPPDLTRRLLTHGSHPAATTHGHNARFAFIGRRVLDAYLLLFLSSSSALDSAKHDTATLAIRTLNAHVLGEHVAPSWDLAPVLRWTPPISASRLAALATPDSRQPPALLRSVGLYKVHGETVQAIVGGIFHQFGASTAHRVFHTRVLPHVLLPHRPSGLPEAFHDDAHRICERLGGPNGPVGPRQPSPAHSTTSQSI